MDGVTFDRSGPRHVPLCLHLIAATVRNENKRIVIITGSAVQLNIQIIQTQTSIHRHQIRPGIATPVGYYSSNSSNLEQLALKGLSDLRRLTLNLYSKRPLNDVFCFYRLYEIY